MSSSLDAIFSPRSVAVFGASEAMHRFGARRFRSLVEGGFKGEIYPVHPTNSQILGYKAYRSLRDIPAAVDLVVVMVRAELVDSIIDDCAALGIPGVIVLTGGFSETGDAGRAHERSLVEKLRRSGGRMVGANCAGLFSGAGGVNVLGWRTVARGPVALITQSGNMARTFAQQAQSLGLGFSKIVSIGNAADLNTKDYIEYLFDDPDTRVIVCYVEGFAPGEGRALYELMRDSPRRKPVIMLKPGLTESGRRAALSHTGSLAGEDRIVDAAFRQCGILRARDCEEAWAAAVAIAGLPAMRAPGVVVISDGGGHATVVSDNAAHAGLSLPELPPATQAELAQILPPRATVCNPVDFAGKAEEEPGIVPRAVDVCLSAKEVGGVILAGHFGGYFKDRTEATALQEIAAGNALADSVAMHGKAFILHTVYGMEALPALVRLREASVPVFGSLELAARAMGMLWQHSKSIMQERRSVRASNIDGSPGIERVLARASGKPLRLAEPDARELLTLCGVNVPRTQVVTSAERARAVVEEFAAPVAMKLIAAELVHKSDAGGVLLNISGGDAAAKAFEALMKIARRIGITESSVLVTPMVKDGVEIVVGGFRDDQFGPVVMCGLGGVHVEILGDVVFRLAPLDVTEARKMLCELRGARIFDQFRGRPALAVNDLAELLVQVSRLIASIPRVTELDLNPVLLKPDGCVVVDARAVLSAS